MPSATPRPSPVSGSGLGAAGASGTFDGRLVISLLLWSLAPLERSSSPSGSATRRRSRTVSTGTATILA